MRRLRTVILIALCFFMLACKTTTTTADDSRISIGNLVTVGGAPGNWIYVFTDPDTGIQYLIVDGGEGGGRAITPRYKNMVGDLSIGEK